METLMKCGHVAMAHDIKGNPYCIICDCKEVAEELPSLEGRMATCSYCGHEKKSSFDLPFFEYRKDKKTDEYYCGCKGWD
jgi:hypothetical protein